MVVERPGLDQPALARLEVVQGAAQPLVRGADERADVGAGSVAGPDLQGAGGVGQLAEEPAVVEHRLLDDGQAGGRALLPGVAEGGCDEVLHGEVEVGRRGDDHGVLARGLGVQAQVGPPVEERRAVSAAPVRIDRGDVGVGDEAPADLVVGARQELQDVAGDRRRPTGTWPGARR